MNPDAALKALAEPHRRAILQLVARDPRPVGDIAGHLDITPQAVSRHLKVLHEAGLVDERREGTRHLFVVNPGGFRAVQEFLAGFWAEHLGRLKTTLQDHDDPADELTSVSELFATEVDLPAPAEEVFRHLTDPAAMIRWMGQHATLRPVPGGAFEIDINGVPVRGRYLELDPPRRVLVSWGVAGNPALPPGATQVEFTLTPTPPAPACAWSTAASPPTRHPSTPPAGSISSADWPWPRPARTPAQIPGIRPPAPATDQDKARIGHAAPPRTRQPARLRYAAVRLARCHRLPCGARPSLTGAGDLLDKVNL